MSKNGIILIDKSIGMTSREVDNKVGRLFSTHKVGHLGTLDPFASGLLIVALNGGTKFLPYLPDDKKTYIATLLLGKKSSTGDTEGEISEEQEVGEINEDKVKEALSSFLGESYQLPPLTSAIKVDGVPLYKYAHKGIEKERKKRLINVYDISLLSIVDKEISFKVTVSSGTYIRVLGEDIASKLGSVGYLTSLRRVAIGDISVEDAIKLEEVDESRVTDPTPFVTGYPHLEIDEVTMKMVKDGRTLDLKSDYGEKLLLVHKGSAIAIYSQKENSLYKAERGLFS